MSNKDFVLTLLVVFALFAYGNGLQCYTCNNIGALTEIDACASGRQMEKEYCPPHGGYVCSEYKYTVQVFNTTLRGTSRGCQKVKKGNLCEDMRLETKKFGYGLVKLKGCYICDKNLCNSVVQKRYRK